jgi:hypothetical protein
MFLFCARAYFFAGNLFHTIREINLMKKMIILVVLTVVFCAAGFSQRKILGISADGKYFTIDGVPTYMNGISYYGALSRDDWSADIAKMKSAGINWVRVFVTCIKDGAKAGENGDFSAVDLKYNIGEKREPYFSRFVALAKELDDNNITLDCTFGTWGRTETTDNTERIACIKKIGNKLRKLWGLGQLARNVYIDAANEWNTHTDGYFPSYPEVRDLVKYAKNPNSDGVIDFLATASVSGEPDFVMMAADIRELIQNIDVDFVACHFPYCYREVEGRTCAWEIWPETGLYLTEERINWVRDKIDLYNNDNLVPIHLQENFRL